MNRLLIWAGVAVAILLLLWRLDHISGDRDSVKLERDQLRARAESLQNTLRLQRELNADLEELDRKHTEDLTNAQAENAQLATDVAAGKRRLRLQASCPSAGVSDSTGTAGMDDGGTAELTPAARQYYFALRDQLTRTEAALAGLQSYVSTVCR
ncbi:lysis protein [Halopseudomonas bauzanensis]|uniref:lysis protein n=1 Tax=Halopseudomonas bauzanensis TaxID=653930 RepID=UPI00255247AF|nr:lysis protein [Halopseudomonas bauzanensis]